MAYNYNIGDKMKYEGYGVVLILCVLLFLPIAFIVGGWAYNANWLSNPEYFNKLEKYQGPSSTDYLLLTIPTILSFSFIAVTLKYYFDKKKIPFDYKLFLLIFVILLIEYILLSSIIG